MWLWCLNKCTFFFFTAPCLLIKDAPSWAQLMNIDSSLTNTNDSILTHILLFGQASLDISANTLILNATRKYIISTKRFQESLSLVFCNFLLHFHLFNFFPYPYYVFFWDYTSIFIWFLGLLFYLLTFFYTLFLVISWCLLNIKRHLVTVIFCSICLYVRYSYTKKLNLNLIYPSS